MKHPTTSKGRKRTVKKVRGWVILGMRNSPVAVEIGAKRPERYSIGTWGFELNKHDKTAVPCTITYSAK